MEYFASMTHAMMIRAIGETPDSIEPSELKELWEVRGKIIADPSQIGPKELEAFLNIDLCRTYDQLAKLIMKREKKKNISTGDYKRLLASLRTRAHRGRKKLIKRIIEIYDTED